MGEMNIHFPCSGCGEMIYFDVLQMGPDGTNKGKCQLCGREYDFNSGGSGQSTDGDGEDSEIDSL